MPTIRPGLTIPARELRFETSRSSGPGGQNVNKVESRVTVAFDLAASPSLTEEEKSRIRERLASRISRQGVLRVAAQRYRTQAANRKVALERFVKLLQEALAVDAPRRPTSLPAAEKVRRLENKRLRGRLKRERRSPEDWNDQS